MKKLVVTVLLSIILVFGLVACTGAPDYAADIQELQQKIQELEAKNALIESLNTKIESLESNSDLDHNEIGTLKAQVALIEGKITYDPNRVYKLNEKITLAYNGYKLYEVTFGKSELNIFYIDVVNFTNPSYIGDTFYLTSTYNIANGIIFTDWGDQVFGNRNLSLKNNFLNETTISINLDVDNIYRFSYRINQTLVLPIADIDFSQSA